MKPFLLILLWLLTAPALAANAPLQAAFDKRYADYFQAGSQTALPFTRMEKQEWKTLNKDAFQVVFSEPDRYYIGKSYTFKLYHDPAKNLYYLDAIGGFWGMEELVFGPIHEQELK